MKIKFISGALLVTFVTGFSCVIFVNFVSAAHPGVDMSDMRDGGSSALVLGCCKSEAADHMEAWKGVFQGTLLNLQNLIFILLTVLAVLYIPDFLKPTRLRRSSLLSISRLYIREHPDIAIFDHLHLALRKGILNPKTF